ncbi:MAG: hypothetical protein Q8P45_01255 [Candidatus Harrisonbacteria bacterium]|nr:hypothetical protein [Candidatus Harrisonbacteria bacterium]
MESSPVGVNEAAILTATGGDGSYLWSGQNLNITEPTGNQFAVSYSAAGTYLVNVSSGGQTATCAVIVTGTTSSGNLVCSPATQTVTLGQTATFSATGGDGNYVWTAPDLTIANSNGSGFSANYASAGLKTLTVTSDGLTARCTTNVLSGAFIPTTPGFPNTGGGYGR